MWGAARASCVLRSVPKSKLMADPAMSGLRRITGWGNNGALRAFWMASVPAARLALRASRLTTVAAAVPSGIAADLLWVKYERCVNESVDGGVFR